MRNHLRLALGPFFLFACAAAGAAQTAPATAYLPDVAGPGSTIVATFTQRAVVTFEDKSGRRTSMNVVAGADGRLVFKVAKDAVAVLLGDAKCVIARDGVVPGTAAVADIPRSGPAIVRAATAYERGGSSHGLVNLGAQRIDAATARVLVDGNSLAANTVAASDMNVKALLHDDIGLGRHSIALQSGGKRSNAIAADVVELHAQAPPPGETGSVQTLAVRVDGLPAGDSAYMNFSVSGSARLEDGGETTRVPVENGVAQVRIRGEHAGPALISYKLEAELARIAQEVATAPRPRTTSRPPAEKTPGPEPSDVEATPAIYGHDDLVPCRVELVDAYMQPTQGWWQDDKVFDKPDILQRQKPEFPIEYTAPYPLVAQRPTVLTGVYQYEWMPGRARVIVNDRGDPPNPNNGHVVMKIKSNCRADQKGNIDPVRLDFTFGVGASIVWSEATQTLTKIPLRGTVRPNAPFVEYPVKLEAAYGWPAKEGFSSKNTGSYVLVMHAQHLRNKDWTDIAGMEARLRGTIVKTSGMRLHFVPLSLGVPSEYEDDLLEDRTLQLARETSHFMPDLYPVRPGGDMRTSEFRSVVDPIPPLDLSGEVFPDEVNSHMGPYMELSDRIESKLGNRFSLRAILEHQGRELIVMSDEDFERAYGPGGRHAAAFTIGTKVIFLRNNNHYTVVAHELAHTLPFQVRNAPAPADVPWMTSECSKGYHNADGDFAQGLRFIHGGYTDEGREVFDGEGIMQPANDYLHQYTEQCTFRHLAVALQGKSDPPVLIVRGYAGRNGVTYDARFTPFYTLDSVTDETRDDPFAPMHIIVLDATGKQLRAFALRPGFERPHDPPSRFHPTPAHPQMVFFMERIPQVPGAAVVEVVGGGKVLDSKRLSPRAPSVSIISPAAGAVVKANKPVTLRWRMSASRGTALASVLDSIDGGDSYLGRADEQRATQLVLKLTPGAHRLRVVVTDGTRSAEATVAVTAR